LLSNYDVSELAADNT